MNETRAIGSVFHHPQFGLLQVVESVSCEDCIYEKEPSNVCTTDVIVGYCGYNKRTDGKSVIFKPINNE